MSARGLVGRACAVGSRRVDTAANPARAFRVEHPSWPKIGQHGTIWRPNRRRSLNVERSTRCQEPAHRSLRH
eukprot:8868886-Pyramimonas_sp.AAC.1